MKRMSIAEQTLKKQIDRIDNNMEKLADESAILSARRAELVTQRSAVETEMNRLERQRLAMSKKNTP
jgi:septal ring factor EnvC (AmiA/AmiB activator)